MKQGSLPNRISEHSHGPASRPKERMWRGRKESAIHHRWKHRLPEVAMSEPQSPENALVHVVDYDAQQRITLSRLLHSVGYDTSLYASADEFIESAATQVNDRLSCVITDIRLPGLSGLGLQHHLAESRHSPPVIFMTSVPDVQMSVKCMKAGAIDFLTKPLLDQEILDAVAEALQSDRRRRAAANVVSMLESRFQRLSPRERQVMALVTSGKMNKQVARILALSEVTVKIHRGSVMKKMAAGSLVDLVKMAQVLAPQLQSDVGAPLASRLIERYAPSAC